MKTNKEKKEHTIYCREWRKKNKDKVRTSNFKYRFYNGGNRKANDIKYYEGNREPTLKRDGYICTECKLTDNKHRKLYGYGLVVHHKDGKGKNSKIKNNDIGNLVTICCVCHGKIHNGGHGKRKTK